MPEDKRKINCWIPVSLYDKIGFAGYENTTQAIITALQRLLENPGEDTKGSSGDIEGYKKDLERIQKDLNQDITGYKEDIKALQSENAKLKEDFAKAPDREELIKLQVTNEGLKSLLEERNKRIEEINSHYENISAFANYFKSSGPKLIEAPEAEKKKPWYRFW
jgi:predicted RNase H-like nuclease (RuvC/YqgF family)